NILLRQWGRLTVSFPDRDPGVFPNGATAVVNGRDLQGRFIPSQPWFANGMFGGETYLERMRRLTAEQPSHFHPLIGDEWSRLIQRIAAAVRSLRKHGADLVFIRLPTAGALRASEIRLFPRADYWDRLVREADAPGFHFDDHVELQTFENPD